MTLHSKVQIFNDPFCREERIQKVAMFLFTEWHPWTDSQHTTYSCMADAFKVAEAFEEQCAARMAKIDPSKQPESP